MHAGNVKLKSLHPYTHISVQEENTKFNVFNLLLNKDNCDLMKFVFRYNPQINFKKVS